MNLFGMAERAERVRERSADAIGHVPELLEVEIGSSVKVLDHGTEFGFWCHEPAEELAFAEIQQVDEEVERLRGELIGKDFREIRAGPLDLTLAANRRRRQLLAGTNR